MRESLLSADNPEWTDVLRDMQHDVYHFARYAELCARIENGEPRAFVAVENNDTLFVPLIIRRVPTLLCEGENVCDITVPYGYPGPLVSGEGGTLEAGGSFLDRGLEALVSCLRQQGIVSAFLRLHPLLPLDIEAFHGFGSRGSVRRDRRDRSGTAGRCVVAADALEPSSRHHQVPGPRRNRGRGPELVAAEPVRAGVSRDHDQGWSRHILFLPGRLL